VTGWVLQELTKPIGGQPLQLRPYVCRNSLIYRVLRAAVKWRDGTVGAIHLSKLYKQYDGAPSPLNNDLDPSTGSEARRTNLSV